MFEKWWGPDGGFGFNCLLAIKARPKAITNPIRDTIKAASFKIGGIVMTGIFGGTI